MSTICKLTYLSKGRGRSVGEMVKCRGLRLLLHLLPGTTGRVHTHASDHFYTACGIRLKAVYIKKKNVFSFLNSYVQKVRGGKKGIIFLGVFLLVNRCQ